MLTTGILKLPRIYLNLHQWAELTIWLTLVCVLQELPQSIGVILGFDSEDSGSDPADSGPALAHKPAHRPDACSNGPLRESCSQNSCKVAFIS